MLPEPTRKSLDYFLKSIHPISRFSSRRFKQLRISSPTPPSHPSLPSYSQSPKSSQNTSLSCTKKPVISKSSQLKRPSYLKPPNLTPLQGKPLPIRSRSKTPEINCKKSVNLITRIPFVQWLN